MSDEQQDFDPSEHTAPEVVEHLSEADEAERRRVAAAELAEREKPRVSVMEAAGVDPNVRMDASGRELLGHEVAPKPAKG